MTVQDIVKLLPDGLLQSLSSDDQSTIDYELLQKLIDKAQSIVSGFQLRNEGLKEEFVLHFILSSLYERYGMFDQARAHQQYVQSLLANMREYIVAEETRIATTSDKKKVDTSDIRNWWWW